jgi:outer membrane receptor protein involved in Fe transport
MLTGINERGRYPNRPNLEDIDIAVFNPDIQPERSITYEAGVQTEISHNVGLRVTAYYRSLSDLIGVNVIESTVGGYISYDNVDFGNSQGVEIVLTKRMGQLFSARINYTLSRSEISSASPVTASQRVGSPLAFNTFLADWDRTHDLTSLFAFRLPADFTASFITRIRSGRPYSVLAERPNTERAPTFYNVDARLSKSLNLLSGSQRIYLQIYNVFNRRNIYSVYTRTGRWDDDGDSGTSYELTANPRRISPGTNLRLGIRFQL